MDDAAREGLLKKENTHNVLLDIRHNQLTCEETKEKLVKEVDSKFNEVINQLKLRKMAVLKEIDQHFEA